MRVRAMVNGTIPPVIPFDKPGQFRQTLFMGKRFYVDINDPQIEQAIEEALDQGHRPEIWIERIV
ncbi:MAG: hypothetical protein M0Q91_10115 [Methanoregula sp.]|nr:hypothetical protein [Methanoregula sp.]